MESAGEVMWFLKSPGKNVIFTESVNGVSIFRETLRL
jgi:hypothetical protein